MGEVREVFKEGEEDKGKDKEKGKRGEENKTNIFIIIIFKGCPTFY